jgi:hypothetical protein
MRLVSRLEKSSYILPQWWGKCKGFGGKDGFRLCEQRFLSLEGLFFTSLSHDKEVKRRKRA